MPNKIALFFENHYDPANIETLTRMLPDLKKAGYKTICFEAFSSKNIATLIKENKENQEKFSRYLKILPKESDGFYLAEREIEVLRSELTFMETVKKEKLNFVLVDVKEKESNQHIRECNNDNDCILGLNGKATKFFNYRNEVLTNNIDNSITKYHEDVVAIIGHRHYYIQKLLSNKGHEHIHSFFIAKYPTGNQLELLFRSNSSEGEEYRSKNFPLGINMLDLDLNPNLKAECEVGNILGLDLTNFDCGGQTSNLNHDEL